MCQGEADSPRSDNEKRELQVREWKVELQALSHAELFDAACVLLEKLLKAENRVEVNSWWTEVKRAQKSRQARMAVNKRHQAPGGAHEKQAAIRAIWASGKYTTRARCAEEEAPALGISYDAARKALRNIPPAKLLRRKG